MTIGKPFMLPPMIEKNEVCDKCYSNKICTAYALSIENIEEVTSKR